MSGEQGSATVVMSALVAVIAVVGLAVASIAVAYAARAQASNAADAAALAAAVATYPPAAELDPVSAARYAARQNGAYVVRCGCSTDPSLNARVVEVVTGLTIDVPVFGRLLVEGVARAEFDPRLWLEG